MEGGGPMGLPDYVGPPQRRIGGFGGCVQYRVYIYVSQALKQCPFAHQILASKSFCCKCVINFAKSWSGNGPFHFRARLIYIYIYLYIAFSFSVLNIKLLLKSLS